MKATSQTSWLASLEASLKRRKTERPPRIAILGVGNVWRGDDGAGIEFIRVLRQKLACVPNSLLVIDAGSAPENFTGPVRAFEPQLVLLVDAAQMNTVPGTLQLFDAMQARGFGSTHTLALHMCARYLKTLCHCKVLLLGIQPSSNAWGTTLSPRVRSGVTRAASDFAAALEASA